jgi:hypothetical protein
VKKKWLRVKKRNGNKNRRRKKKTKLERQELKDNDKETGRE